MDWHITKIEKDYGTGWTGYSWNKELFPDPKGFMEYLHNKGYTVTLNLHDREGVAPHEECYEEMAKALGMDPKEKKKNVSKNKQMLSDVAYLHSGETSYLTVNQ